MRNVCDDEQGKPLSIAEAHGPRLPELPALGEALELILIVWEASQGTPLPAYVSRFTTQLRQREPIPAAAGGGGEGYISSSSMSSTNELSTLWGSVMFHVMIMKTNSCHQGEPNLNVSELNVKGEILSLMGEHRTVQAMCSSVYKSLHNHEMIFMY